MFRRSYRSTAAYTSSPSSAWGADAMPLAIRNSCARASAWAWVNWAYSVTTWVGMPIRLSRQASLVAEVSCAPSRMPARSITMCQVGVNSARAADPPLGESTIDSTRQASAIVAMAPVRTRDGEVDAESRVCNGVPSRLAAWSSVCALLPRGVPRVGVACHVYQTDAWRPIESGKPGSFRSIRGWPAAGKLPLVRCTNLPRGEKSGDDTPRTCH